MTKRVAILYNAPVLPADHPDYVSEAGVLESVEAFAAALGKAGHEVTRIGIGQSLARLVARLTGERPDVVVNFCEGFSGHSSGEVYVTGLLELLGLPYTGTAPESLGLARDKVRAKQVLAAAGVPTAEYWLVNRREDLIRSPVAAGLRQALSDMKLFVKPAAEDASLGIDERSVVENWDALVEKVAELQSRYGDVLVERYLDGREFNVGVIVLPEPRALPIAEIEFCTDSEFRWPIVTYDSKWAERSTACRRTPVRCPADVDEATASRVRSIALAAFCAIGCRDYARVDLRLTSAAEVFVLEVNANPDAAPSSGLARALAAAGISYDDFALRLVEAAARRGPVRPATVTSLGDRVTPIAPVAVLTRPLQPADRQPLLEILAACQMFRPEEIEVADEILGEAIRDGAGGHYQVLVAEAAGRAVGWSCHGRVPLTDATYDMYWIAVHPDHQGRRVGRILLDEIERSLGQAAARWLLAETSSSPLYAKTRSFYAKSGFTIVGDVPDFYRSNDGRITYGKRLNEAEGCPK